MRLTLRTLLAFRDGVLSPQVHEDLHRRIQQNTPVANLLQQINELVRMSEIRTPNLEVSGAGDANVVAEYLDDELDSETVAELERLCLQNVDHLCELAHCHQLLAEALHTHVSVPDSLQRTALSLMNPKQREAVRRGLLTRAKRKAGQEPGEDDSATQSTSVDGTKQNSAASGGKLNETTSVKSPLMETSSGSIRQTGLDLESSPLASEVPAYLLASQRKRWQIPAAILVLTAVLVLLVWESLGSLDSLRSLWQVSSAPVDQSGKSLPSSEPKATLEKDAVSQLPGSDNANTLPITSSELSNGKQQTSGPSGNSKDAFAQATNGLSTPERQPTSPSLAAPSTDPAVLEPTEQLESLPDKHSDTPQLEVKRDPDTSPQGTDFKREPAGETLNTAPGVLMFSEKESELGKAVVFIAEDSGSLQLLSEQSSMVSGRVVIPPSVRTLLQLGSWLWTTGGATIADFEPTTLSDGRGPSIVLNTQLFRGIFTCSDASQGLTLRTPIGTYELRGLAPRVWLAVEVASRPVVRGSLSQAGTHAPVLIIVAGFDGDVAPKELAHVVAVEADQRFVLSHPAQGISAVDGQPPSEFSLQNPPRWYSKRSIRLIDQEASRDFLDALHNRQNSLSEQIVELTKHERPELAALAIQSSLLMGNWRPLVSELLVADRLRAHWTTTLELARQVAVGNESAQTTLRELLREDFGADAPRMYQLFDGLSRQQHNVDGLTELLKGLESESLPIRVLSSFELTQLTGSDHNFLPHAPVKATIQQIRRLLNTGKLSVVPVPDPIWERTPQL